MEETSAYIAARVRVAGGDAERIFTSEAIVTVHRRSGGIPRTISVICDNTLVSGFALDRRPVDQEVVVEVCDDFDFEEHAPLSSGGLGAAAHVPAASSPWDFS